MASATADPAKPAVEIAAVTPDAPPGPAADRSRPDPCVEKVRSAAAAATVLFASGSAQVPDSDTAKVDEVARLAAACAGVRIEIGGHTDLRGPEGTNFMLSWQRAEAIAAVLRQKGLDPAQFDIVGYGTRKPAVTVPLTPPVAAEVLDPDSVARAMAARNRLHARNRRVELKVR